MKTTDLLAQGSTPPAEVDVCIIGSGPCGLSIALELIDAPLSVLVVESGSDVEPVVPDEGEPADALSAIESVGKARAVPLHVRRRHLGGTSTVWTGRCAPFDPIDYEDRAWVPGSGWPIDEDALAPELARAAAYLGLSPVRWEDLLWRRLSRQSQASGLDASVLRDQLWQFSVAAENDGPVRFQRYRDRVEASANVQILLHATVTQIRAREGGRVVDRVELSTPRGERRAEVRAKTVIVAAGGIDNARLLLASRADLPVGLGNEHDLVGRYLTDHPYVDAASLTGRAQLQKTLARFGHYWLDDRTGRHTFLYGFALSAQHQRERGLLNAAAYMMPEEAEDGAWRSVKRLRGALSRREVSTDVVRDVSNVLRGPMELADAANRRVALGLPPVVPADLAYLGVNVEQAPDPDSRVTLSEALDATGQPLAKVDWRVGEAEHRAVVAIVRAVVSELERIGLPAPTPMPWLDDLDAYLERVQDVAHPMSTTRMGADETTGVCDPHGRVFSTEGLYVAGTSQLPTGGTANPTLMGLAVALRTADAVKRRHADLAASEEARAEHAFEVGAPRARVAVIGAGHRFETIYAPLLAALPERFELVGFRSSREARRAELTEKTGAPGFPTPEAMVEETRPDVVVVAVSSDANHAVAEQALGLGVPLLVETPLGWSTKPGRALVEAIAARGAVFGVAEQFPYLPAEALKVKLIEGGVLGAVFAARNEYATWGYHGVAQARQYLGGARRPVQVLATIAEHGVGERHSWEDATVTYDDGATLAYRFSSAYDEPFRQGRALVVEGTRGALRDEVLRVRTDGGVHEARFERVMVGDSLERVEVRVPSVGGPTTIAWQNPYVGAPLDDEKIAVARHLDALVLAARAGGAPLYDAEDALVDVEILHALRLSAQRGGAVDLPINLRQEMVMRAVSQQYWRSQLERVGRRFR